MKKIKLIALFALTAATVHSQELTKNNTPINQRFGFSLAYFGDKVVNKGLQIGVEKYLLASLYPPSANIFSPCARCFTTPSRAIVNSGLPQGNGPLYQQTHPVVIQTPISYLSPGP